MDQLSQLYVDMACGPLSQLHNPIATIDFVDRMHTMVEKSSAPRKNYLIDTTTPHGDVVITESSAMKPGIGWATLQVTEGIQKGVHEWCIKLENQGETTDGSGLMLGLVPKNFSKYDSFISQGGGWCISRAGKFYGHWRRQDNGGDNIFFSTNDRIIFLLDYDAARLTVRVGSKIVVGEMSNLSMEVFPAVSLHYRHQHVRFEYHVVHDKQPKATDWMEKRMFPQAAAFLPLSNSDLEKLCLDHYVFSNLLVCTMSEVKLRYRQNAKPAGLQNTSYISLETADARLYILSHAIAAVRRYVETTVSKRQFLPLDVTPECLRRQSHDLCKMNNPATGTNVVYDAALNCGAVVMVHVLTRLTDRAHMLSQELLGNVMEHVMTLPVFALSEGPLTTATGFGGAAALSPSVSELAVEGVYNSLSVSLAGDEKASSWALRLMELGLLLGLQRGSINETLHMCRVMLRYPDRRVSDGFFAWLHAHARHMEPKHLVADISSAVADAPSQTELALSVAMEPTETVLSMGCRDGALFVHTNAKLTKWCGSGSQLAVACQSEEPANWCRGAQRSSLAVTSKLLLLVTDLMLPAKVAVVTYSHALEVQQVYKLSEVSSWPSAPSAHPLITLCGGDHFLLLFEARDEANDAALLSHEAKPYIQGVRFNAKTFPEPLSTFRLDRAEISVSLQKSCISLTPSAVVHLGNPDPLLRVPSGHLLVEIWAQVFQKDTTVLFYHHGDKSTTGEIFMEATSLEGTYCIRGGYRHDARGSSVVVAPLPPIGESSFLHIAIQFDGRWHLYINGEEAAVNRSGPHVSLDTPKQVWSIGGGCSFLIGGARVWSVNRAQREIYRDYRRALPSNEPGMLVQLLFNESCGNVIYNYATASSPPLVNAFCSGSFSRVHCEEHPFFMTPTSSLDIGPPIAQEWHDMAKTSCFVHEGKVVLLCPTMRNVMVDGYQFFFYSQRNGCPYSASHIVPKKGPCKGLFATDKVGQLWGLFDMGRHAGEDENVTVSQTAVSLVPLKFEAGNDMDLETMKWWGTDRDDVGDGLPSFSSPSTAGKSAKNADSKARGVPLKYASGPVEQDFESVALWCIDLLVSHAKSRFTSSGQLFTPLCDEVGKKCVDEIKETFYEHFRVVKGTSARRAVTPLNKYSDTILTAAMHILLRLIRRVKVFGLHPSTVGLSVSDAEETSIDDHIFIIVKDLCVLPRRRTSASSAPSSPKEAKALEPAGANAMTLLSLLADTINEGGLTLSRELGRLAEGVVYEGIDLFFHSARSRSRLLRETLSSSSFLGGSVHRERALNVVLEAVVHSLSRIEAAAPLLSAGMDNASTTGGAPVVGTLGFPEAQIEDLISTLDVVLRECVCQFDVGTSNKATAPRHLLDLSAIVNTFQILLFCTMWKETPANVSDTASTVAETHDGKLKSRYVASPTADQYVKRYYSLLFKAVANVLDVLHASNRRDDALPHELLHSFLSTPLHVALCAIPPFVTFDSAPWFMDELNKMFEKLKAPYNIIEFITNTLHDSESPLCVLEDAVRFPFVWTASFMRNPPKAIKSKGRLCAARLMDLPHFKEGVASGGFPATPRREKVLHLLAHTPLEQLDVYKKMGALRMRMGPRLATLVTAMAGAALYLCNIPRLHLLSDDRLRQMLDDVVKRLLPAFCDVLSQVPGETKEETVYDDMQKRCDFLFSLYCPFDEHVLDTALYLYKDDVGNTAAAFPPALHTPESIRRRWKWALRHVKRKLLLSRCDIVSTADLSLTETIHMVSEFVLSRAFTAQDMEEELDGRRCRLKVRLRGILSCLTEGMNSTVSALLMMRLTILFTDSHESCTAGLNGCDRDECLAIRENLYMAWQFLLMDNISDASARAVSIMLMVISHGWIARDLCFMENIRLVPKLFHLFGTIFEADGTRLKPESEMEYAHRAEVLTYQATLRASACAYGGNFSSSSDDGAPRGAEDDERTASLLLTRREVVLRQVMDCLRHLGHHSAIALRKEQPVVERVAHMRLLQEIFDICLEEFNRALTFYRSEIPVSKMDASRVHEQINVIVSVLSRIAAVLPEKDGCFTGPLCRVVSRITITLFKLSQQIVKVEDGAVAFKDATPARLRVIFLLLRCCSPSECNKVFYETFSTMKGVSERMNMEKKNSAISFLIFYLVSLMTAEGLSESAMQGMEGMRQLLLVPHWAAQLSGVKHVFNDLLKLVGHRQDTFAYEQNNIKLFVWMAVLGGYTLCLPSKGSLVRFSGTDRALAELEGYIVDSSTSSNKGHTVTVAYHVKCDAESSPQKREEAQQRYVNAEKQLSVDEILLPSLTDVRPIASYEGMVRDYLTPAINAFYKRTDRNWSVVELSAALGFLYMALVLVKQSPTTCEALVAQGLLSTINLFANRILARSPLPVAFASEYVTYGVNLSIMQCVQALQSSMLQRESCATDTTAPELRQEPSSSSLTSSSLLAVQPLSSNNRTDLETSPQASTASSPRLFSTLQLMARFPTPALCFLAHQERLPACMVAAPAAHGSDSLSFPLWSDGMSAEVSILFCDQLFPECGQRTRPPTSWSPAPLQMDIISFFATPSSKSIVEVTPFLKVCLDGNTLACHIRTPKMTSTLIKCEMQMFQDDWDHFIYIAAVLEANQITLVKSAEVSTSALPPAVAEELRLLFEEEGAVTHAVLGTLPTASADLGMARLFPLVVDATRVVVSGFRVWGSSATKSATGAVAAHVMREQVLPPLTVTDDTCYFRMTECTGGKLLSFDSVYEGVLSGAVSWTPLPEPRNVVPSLDRSDKLRLGVSTLVPNVIPRSAIFSYLVSLEPLGLFWITTDLLWTLVAHLSRLTISSALAQCMGPAYLLTPSVKVGKLFDAKRKKVLFNPHYILESKDLVRQVANLFRYSNTGVLGKESALQIHTMCNHFLDYFTYVRDTKSSSSSSSAKHNSDRDTTATTPGHPAGSSSTQFFRETALTMCELIFEERNVFLVAAPQGRSMGGSDKDGGEVEPPTLPLALVSSVSALLSFDPNSHGIERAVVYKDKAQKNLLLKYPDNQGGWPDCPIQPGLWWLYVRLKASNPHPAGVDGRSAMALSVAVQSMAPVVLRTFLKPFFEAIRKGRFREEVHHFLNSQVILSFYNRGGAGGGIGESTHPLAVFTSLLELWAVYPEVNPFDRVSLPIMLANINSPLSALLRRDTASSEVQGLLSLFLCTYNSYIQSLCGLLVAAVRLQEAWSRTDYRVRMKYQWRKIIALWKRSSSACPESNMLHGVVRLEQVMNRTNPIDIACFLHQKGGGEWEVRSEASITVARSSVGFSQGRFYFEVRVVGQGSKLAVGVMTEKGRLFVEGGGSLGGDGNSWAFDNVRGGCVHGDGITEFTSRQPWRAGDVLGVLIDLEGNRLTCLHNGAQMGVFRRFQNRGDQSPSSPSAKRNEGTYFYPAVAFDQSGCEVNFGGAMFTGALPTGYLPVDPAYFSRPETVGIWVLCRTSRWAEALQGSSNKGAHVATSSQGLLADPSFNHVHQLVEKYCYGRNGPLTVELSCLGVKSTTRVWRVVPAEVTPCVVSASVTVYAGKWYYEMIVLSDEAAFSIGWVNGDAKYDALSGKKLGDDEASWVLEGKRMIGRHHKHQVSLGRHTWRKGDVVGCQLDCDAQVMLFTVNGVLQRPVHDERGDGVLFYQFQPAEKGLTPLVYLETKASMSFLWHQSDQQYRPEGFKSLGATDLLRSGIIEYFLLSDHMTEETKSPQTLSPSPPSTSNLAPVTVVRGMNNLDLNSTSNTDRTSGSSNQLKQLKALLYFITRNCEISPTNMRGFCLDRLLGITPQHLESSGQGGEDERPTAIQGMNARACRSYFHVLTLASAAAESLHPYAHSGCIPLDVEDRSCVVVGALQDALDALLQVSLPYVGLRYASRFFAATKMSGESLKLTVNRRKALLVVNDLSVAPDVRLKESLFGQIFALLEEKGFLFFCTSKKLWSISFVGEGADDVGGPYRESLAHICSELMSNKLPLFLPCPNQTQDIGDTRDAFVINPSMTSSESLRMYNFIGRLIGGCLRSEELLSIYLPSSVWKALVGVECDVSDLEHVDVAAVQSLRYLTELMSRMDEVGAKGIDEQLDELVPGGFTTLDDADVEHELFTGGAGVKVDHTNVADYVRLVQQFKLNDATREQREALVQGFHLVVPLCSVSSVKWYELEELVCGRKDYDPDVLLANCSYEGLTPDDERVLYLRQVLRGFSRHQRAMFMRFVSGRERLPSTISLRILSDDGAPLVEGGEPVHAMEGAGTENSSSSARTDQPAGRRVSSAEANTRLPHASTCFYQLVLPHYTSVEELREKLLLAIEYCLDIDADFRVRDGASRLPHNDSETRVHVEEDDDEEFEDYTHLQ